MAERLEIDVKQSITVNDQTQGPATTSQSSQAPSTSTQPSGSTSQPSTATPEAIPTAQTQAVTPELAAPKVPSSKESKDFLSRSAKKLQELEAAGMPIPDWLKSIRERYQNIVKAVETVQAKAIEVKPQDVPQEEESSKKKGSVKVPKELVKKLTEPATTEPVETVAAEAGGQVAAEVAEPLVAAGTEAATSAAESAVVAGTEAVVEGAAVAGTEAAATAGGEVLGTVIGAGGGAGIGAATGAAAGAPGGPPGMAIGAAIGAIAGQVGAEYLTQALQSLIDTVKLLDNSMMQMAKDAAEYSPDVALAESVAEIEDMFAQIRRADELGPELSQFVEARSELTVDIQNLITDIAPIFIEFMTVVLKSLDVIITLIRAFVDIIKQIWDSAPMRALRAGAETGRSALESGIMEWIAPVTAYAVKLWFSLYRREKEKEDDYGKEMQQAVKDFLNPKKLEDKLKSLPGTKGKNPRKGFS